MTTTQAYLLGHEDEELRRLEHQAQMLAPATRIVLRQAGIEPGMRVLDLGTGAGDVAFEVAGWITEAFRRSNLDMSLGARLEPIMRSAGLADPTAIGLQSYFAPDDPVGARLAAATARTLLPVIVRTGVATPEEVDVDTLEARCAAGLRDSCAIFKAPVLVGAWAWV